MEYASRSLSELIVYRYGRGGESGEILVAENLVDRAVCGHPCYLCPKQENLSLYRTENPAERSNFDRKPVAFLLCESCFGLARQARRGRPWLWCGVCSFREHRNGRESLYCKVVARRVLQEKATDLVSD